MGIKLINDGWLIFKRLRATAGQGPNYVGPSYGYVGLWASCWPMLSQKIRKMGTAKKHCKTQEILMVGGLSWGHVGPSWGYVGLSWGQCGPILGLCWAILGLCWPILGLCWPILELCWPILGLCWPILGLCWPILRPMLAHLEAYLGPCWPSLNHKIRKMGKHAKSTKHRKTGRFLAGGSGRRQGARPLSPTERRETPSAMPRPGGPWPDWGWLVVVCEGRFGVGGLGLGSGGLCFWVSGWWVGGGRSWSALAGMEWVGWGRSVVDGACGLVGWGWSVGVSACGFGVGGSSVYARGSGVGALGLITVGLCQWVWGWWVDQCWFVPVGLGLVGWGRSGPPGGRCCPMLAHLRAMLGHLRARLAHLGAMLAHLGAMLAHLVATLAHLRGYVGPVWSYIGPSCGDVGPSWGLCWPILGLCWPILRPMLAQVDPSETTRSEKWEKMGWAQNTVKRDSFWRAKVSAAGGAAPLSYGEERNAFGKDTARGPLAGLKGYALCRRPLETGGSCLPLRRKHIGQKLQLSLCTEAIWSVNASLDEHKAVATAPCCGLLLMGVPLKRIWTHIKASMKRPNWFNSLCDMTHKITFYQSSNEKTKLIQCIIRHYIQHHILSSHIFWASWQLKECINTCQWLLLSSKPVER